MAIDWGRALSAGLGGAAKAGMGELQADQDEQRWLEREKQMRAFDKQNEHERARFLAGLKPPEKQTVSTVGADGKPMKQEQRWAIPAEGEAEGHFENVGDAIPDINFEKLEETQRNNEERTRLSGEANAARSDAAAARLGMERERLDAARTKREGTETQPKPYTFTGKDGKTVTRYGTFQNGKFQPSLDETGAPIQGDKFRPSVFEEKREASANATKGTLRQFADALGLGAMADTFGGAPKSATAPTAPAPTAAPTAAPAAPTTINGKRVVRTGKKNGQPIALLEDGTVAPL